MTSIRSGSLPALRHKLRLASRVPMMKTLKTSILRIPSLQDIVRNTLLSTKEERR
jgi:hypothetical protein